MPENKTAQLPQTAEMKEYIATLERKNIITRIAKLINQVRLDIFLMDDEIRSAISDEEVTEVQYAVYRTIANLTIGLLDFIPAGPGEVGSWGADTLKLIKKIQYFLSKHSKLIEAKFPRLLDLTPDVSTAGAILTELSEPLTGGLMPSHLVYEFPLQLRYDIKIMEQFLKNVFLIKAHIKAKKEGKLFESIT